MPSAWLSQRVLVQEQAFGGLQRSFIVGGDEVGVRPRKQVERRLADDRIMRQAELNLGDPVGQHVTAVARVLHGDLRGDVVDDLAQECVVAVAFLFEVSAKLTDLYTVNSADLVADSAIIGGLTPGVTSRHQPRPRQLDGSGERQ